MSNPARQFVDRWEFENVAIVTPSKRSEEAQRLASQCREDAARAGISEQDLEDAVGGDLIANMVLALGEAVFRQLAREQWPDEKRRAKS
jgi:hypothetical protein